MAALIVESHEELRSEMSGRFEQIDERFDRIERRLDTHDDMFRGIHGELTEINRKLDRIDLRLAALELAVFGTSDSTGRTTEDSILSRLARLEQKVFKAA